MFGKSFSWSSVCQLEFQKNEFGIQKKNYQDQRNSNRKYNINNCKIISFYAEKGGVCKTTNTINLAYAFAANGKRVLIYDCDSQRSSTAALLGLRLLNDQYIDERSPLTSLINRPINQGYHRTLYDQVMDNERNVKPCEAIPIANNIWLVPGNRETNILETTIALEESYSRNKTPFHLNQKTGKPYASIIETAKDYKIDYVFLDLNPNKGVLNRCLIFSSHYIIVPAVADFHSSEMMSSMKENLVNWYNEIKTVRGETLAQPGRPTTDFPITEFNPKFLGFILNRIDSNNIGEIKNGIEVNTYRRAEEVWKRKIEYGADELSTLENFQDNGIKIPLAISGHVYLRCSRSNNLGIIRNFNTLKNISDIVHIPVPFLEERHMIEYDHVNDIVRNMPPQNREKFMEKTLKFRQVFQEIYNTIVMIIHLDNNNESATL